MECRISDLSEAYAQQYNIRNEQDDEEQLVGKHKSINQVSLKI